MARTPVRGLLGILKGERCCRITVGEAGRARNHGLPAALEQKAGQTTGGGQRGRPRGPSDPRLDPSEDMRTSSGDGIHERFCAMTAEIRTWHSAASTIVMRAVPRPLYNYPLHPTEPATSSFFRSLRPPRARYAASQKLARPSSSVDLAVPNGHRLVGDSGAGRSLLVRYVQSSAHQAQGCFTMRQPRQHPLLSWPYGVIWTSLLSNSMSGLLIS